MDVTLLWFQCKNPDCDYIPVKTKKDKIQRYWKHGISLQESKRQRLFMRYVEGSYRHRGIWPHSIILFDSKLYGTILLHNEIEPEMPTNSYHYPILDKELCNPCINKIQNERVLFG